MMVAFARRCHCKLGPLLNLALLTLALLASPTGAQGQADALLIGQSGGFTGGQASYSKDVKTGIEAAFAGVNSTGGIGGRPLKLVTADDGGRRDAVLANTRKLVEQDKVLALIGYTSGAGTEVSLKYIDEARVPILSPATGNMGIRLAGSPYLFHTRAGYDAEMAKIIGHVAKLGYTKVGLAYLDDVGPANLKAMQDALAANGLSASIVVGLDRNSKNFDPQIEKLLGANPQLVVFISNAAPIAAIVKGMRSKGYGGQFATSSFAGSRIVQDLRPMGAGLIMIQVLPQPKHDHLRFHQQFHADLTAAAPGVKANYTILEGYVAARTLIEALRRAGSNATRAQLVSALETMPELDFGGYRIRFSKDNRNGSRFVDLGVVTGDGSLRF